MSEVRWCNLIAHYFLLAVNCTISQSYLFIKQNKKNSITEILKFIEMVKEIQKREQRKRNTWAKKTTLN